jgi:hypothetical protein
MNASNYKAYLERYLDAGWEPVGEEELQLLRNGAVMDEGVRWLFVYHDMDLWKHGWETVVYAELELGIRPHFMIHHPEDRRNQKYKAKEHVATLRAHPGVTLCWHVNPYDKGPDDFPISPREMKYVHKVLEQHIADMREFIGAFESCTIHGDPQRLNLTSPVLDYIESQGVLSIDRVRKCYPDGRTDLRTSYMTDSGGAVRRDVPPDTEGLLIINTHCGNYDVDEVAKNHLTSVGCTVY